MYKLREVHKTILLAISKKNSPTSPREIAVLYKINPSTVRVEISNLNAFGLVEHWRGLHGLYVLTEAGKKAITDVDESGTGA